jgi:hypothetical protein
VSALGHYIESEGIATVAIGLIRPQIEHTRPPRALWVPFELGRPFGPPSDPQFQTRVVLAALRLLESDRGPVVLEDFPEDDPRERPDPLWHPPLGKAAAQEEGTPLAAAVEAEIAQLRPAYERSLGRRRRTIVGLAGLAIDEAGQYLAPWLRGTPPESPRADMSAPLLLRFVVDDLKAYYFEAALAEPSLPSSRQLADWFWNDTALGAAIFALRRANLANPDDRLKAIAGLFLVPGIRVPPAG